MISGNMVGSYSQLGKTFIITDADGNELTGVVTENVQIFDIAGRLLINVENKETNLLQINVSHLSKGMYFVKVGNYTIKFVKE